jgi:alkanesulfonate monooxygenase SsuD/methylene tetrahydromethanopterin reductase-like flavin-dependent oxidoreductase (luciferase family)
MRYGLDVSTAGEFADVKLLAGLAADAERSGWDGFFIWDCLLGGGESSAPEPVADPWVALTAIALATTRIRIGAFMTPLARRRPWNVARSAATIDQLSGGRLIFGAGLGYREDEFTAVGEDPAAGIRAAKLDEGLAIIDGLWRGRPVSFAGRHFQVESLTILPSPRQQPRIPIWTAAGWPRRRPLLRAARWDGTYLMTLNQQTGQLLQPDEVAEVARCLREARAGRGVSPSDGIDIAINGDLTGIADPTGVLGRFAAAGVTWWVELCQDTPAEERRLISTGPPGAG